MAVASPTLDSSPVAFWAEVRARQQGRKLSRLIAAALLTVAAGLVHLGQVPAHFSEFPVFGVLFLVTGVLQLGLAARLLWAPTGRLFVGAAIFTAGVVAVWVVSRTIGLPAGDHNLLPEVPGMLDMLTSLSEIAALILFLFLIRVPRRPKARGPVRTTLMALPSAVLVIPLLLLGLQAPFYPMPEAAPPVPVKTGDTSIASLVAPPGSEPLHAFTLTAAPSTIDGHYAFAYNGTVPGPELRVFQGERVRVTLVNHLPAPTTIHWHGIVLPNAMDGVAGVTQDAVKPGATFVYEFVAGEPGTFWYHAHQDPLEQIARGLYGALTVLPRTGSTEARDYAVLLHTSVASDRMLINGAQDAHLDARPGDTVRLRLINATLPEGFDAKPVRPYLAGVPYRVAALDGHEIAGGQELGARILRMGMGQRYDVVFKMPASGKVVLGGLKPPSGGLFGPKPKASTLTLGTGDAPAAPGHLSDFDLTAYGAPVPDPLLAATHFDVERTVRLTGGPIFRNGTFDFADSFDGKASPLVPPITVHEGDMVRLKLVNPDDVKWHPIHIHGHVFTVLTRNGRPLTGAPIRLDALLVPPGETWEVAFKAGNPGLWMLHCHVLGHANAGMSMVIAYAGYSSPYTMGTRTGNQPE